MQIFKAHGFDEQLKKLAEEQFELIEALLTYRIGVGLSSSETRKHVAEEMADCLVLMEQFRQRLDISQDEIKKWYDMKVDRELERIKAAEQ